MGQRAIVDKKYGDNARRRDHSLVARDVQREHGHGHQHVVRWYVSCYFLHTYSMKIFICPYNESEKFGRAELEVNASTTFSQLCQLIERQYIVREGEYDLFLDSVTLLEESTWNPAPDMRILIDIPQNPGAKTDADANECRDEAYPSSYVQTLSQVPRNDQRQNTFLVKQGAN